MITFGTDGWRGLIARDFTFDNLRLVALATAKLILKKNEPNPAVVIGYDTRFLSKEFAKEAALIFAWNDIVVHLTNTFSTTPQVSFHTKQKGADLGIVITASHNPPIYNGYKVKAHFGGPATPEMIAELEEELKPIQQRPPQFKFKDEDYYIQMRKIRLFNAKESYIRYIRKKINLPLINDYKFKILFDPMYGAAIDTIRKLIPLGVQEIHNIFNPSFGNLSHPEPIPEHLHDLTDLMKTGQFDIGIATDGDADRLGLVDHEGNFVDSHKIFMILLKYLFEKRKKRGSVAKTVSLTSMVDMYCEKKEIELFQTKVGFKYIAQLMNEKKILIGGEESGGLGTILHIPERDGIFNALLVLEIMATEKKTLKELCEELDEEFGMHRFWRRDIQVTQTQKKNILTACEKGIKKIGKFDVHSVDTTDGYKFFVDSGWLLIRASGTEPLVRFYSEADSLSKVNELLDEGIKLKK